MKSIKLMFLMIAIGMIAFTACSESEQTAEKKENNTISFAKEEDWLELEHSEKREQVIQTVIDFIDETDCSTCRRNCRTTKNHGGGHYTVSCDDGTRYSVTNCGGGEWHVMEQHPGMTQVFYPC